MRYRIFSIFLIISILCSICCIGVSAEDVEYSTVGCTWSKLNDTTFVTDTDGDGNPDVTLVKEGNKWTYYFVVPDDTVSYYVYEDEVPENYTVVGVGDRKNPIKTMDNTKYSHTHNVGDDGSYSGRYEANDTFTDVVTVPGADSLKIVLNMKIPNNDGNYLCMWDGAHEDYTAAKNNSTSRIGQLRYGTPKTYTVQGDSVTFAFQGHSNIGGFSNSNQYWGYYAVITGNFSNQENVAEITNKTTKERIKTGGLTLKKQVAGDDGSTKNFGFNIKLSTDNNDLKKYIDGVQTYGDMTFRDGLGTVYLKHNETVSLGDIPQGVKWSIEEVANSDFNSSFSFGGATVDDTKCNGLIQADIDLQVVCTNTKEPDESEELPKVELRVQKKLDGQYNPDDVFDFHALFSGLSKSLTYSFEQNGKSQEFVCDNDGIADVSFSLTKDQEIVFKNLPVGASYQIIESGFENYKSSFDISGSEFATQVSSANNSENQDLSTSKEVLRENESPVVVFTNKGPDEPDPELITVNINKTWNDNENKDGLRPDYVTVYLLDDGNVVGSARLDSRTNWSAVFTNLEKYRDDGVTLREYTISEVTVPGYISSVNKNENGSVLDFTVENTSVKVGDLFLSKEIKDYDKLGTEYSYATDMAFDFEIELTRDNQPVSGVFNLDSEKGTQVGSIVFDSTGKSEVSLKHGESIYIKDLPENTTYKIIESQYEDFKVDGGSEKTGEIKARRSIDVKFVNVLDTSMPVPLPETGGNGVYGLLGLGVLFIGVGLFVLKSRKGRAV